MRFLKIVDVYMIGSDLRVRMNALVQEPEVFNFTGLEDFFKEVNSAEQLIYAKKCKLEKANEKKFTFFVNPGGRDGYTLFTFNGKPKEDIPEYVINDISDDDGHPWPPGE